VILDLPAVHCRQFHHEGCSVQEETPMRLLHFHNCNLHIKNQAFQANVKPTRLLAFLFLSLAMASVSWAQVAHPDAPDQSELLKNSKDPIYIMRNFKTMYVETKDIDFFGSDQMKSALHGNPDFEKLNIHIVDDRRVADVVLVVSYTFAWDYPFELRHQNTTVVLLAGKGEGPLSGPLGADDVARVFVELATPWRNQREKKP
jgi:hypothetical protein